MKSDEIPKVDTVETHIPGLGKIKGLSYNDSTCQYLGIPYANIPGRFRRSVPSPAWKNGEHDGTKLGPYCPQPPRDFYPIPSAARPWLEMPSADELNCLNLNISVPRLPSQNGSKLPVMVFLHGGAFVYAMGSSPIYDGRILADASANVLSKPTIIITLNYRLGVYGFLAGHDLEAYNKQHGDCGVGNYGIWDQVLALRWIQQHIAGFGGDPNQVTLFGQSAGGVSVHTHLLRDEALFSSAILQSGLIRLCGVMSIDEYQICYENMLLELGISLDLPPAERVMQLLAVSTANVTAAMVPVFITPVITMGLCDDKVLIPGGIPTYAQYDEFKIPEWCPRIMLGDCINECIIWNKAWDNLSPISMAKDADLSTPTAPLLLRKMESYLGAEKAKVIADLYGISEASTPAETFTALERFTSHGMYSALNYFAELASPSVYAWHFDVPSPYDNAWGGMAHHSFDNVLIWSVLKHTLPEGHQRIGEVMVEAWIKFANGEAPWERFDDKKRWMVIKESGAKMMTREEDQGRGYEIWDRLHELDLIKDFADMSVELCQLIVDVTDHG
ncbi:alpha/beta-hydrolase [Mytilinidion resinicola]|uniref:Carboxylic ester hydrolase n=1 Tax=Mytilinidion resinicola TaxID=574789 RepID=A0A6A6YHQ8_9PEZI|nr:alpha/beta-hydrolase [Mytilinidion resinicola]KAF2808119.1 alpha/beta-hydrolase [Mytilinidion resinicola]